LGGAREKRSRSAGSKLTLSLRHDTRYFYVLTLVALCVGLGVVAGIKPTLGLEVAVGLALAGVIFWNVVAGLVLFTLMTFLEVASINNSALSGMKVVGLLLFVSWFTRMAVERRQEIVPLLRCHSRILAFAVAFLAWCVVSIAWAESPGAVGASTWRYANNLILVLVVLGTVTRREHVLWIVGALIVGGLLAAAYGLATPQAATSRDFGRLAGTGLDANGLSAALVVAIAFGAAFLRMMRGRPLVRFLLAAAMVFALISVLDTQSRSGLIALVTLLITMVLIGGRWRRHASVLLVLFAVAALGYVVSGAASSDRHLTSPDTAGRSTLWLVGWRMFEAHPLTGVGAGNFQVSNINYVSQPGAITRADLIDNSAFPVHNIYLQFLAELGLPGLIAFLGIALVAAAAALRAAGIFRNLGDSELELVARCYVGAVAAFLAASFFEPNEFSKQLWLLLALGPGLWVVATLQRARGLGSDAEIRPRSARTHRDRVVSADPAWVTTSHIMPAR
jgi:O-antigen ligase